VYLDLSIAHAPAICLTVLYGPTSLSVHKITKIIKESFEHWTNAGDHAFTLISTRWKKYI
jgi:hypothetical protein